jgi:hypothetical protein
VKETDTVLCSSLPTHETVLAVGFRVIRHSSRTAALPPDEYDPTYRGPGSNSTSAYVKKLCSLMRLILPGLWRPTTFNERSESSIMVNAFRF